MCEQGSVNAREILRGKIQSGTEKMKNDEKDLNTSNT